MSRFSGDGAVAPVLMGENCSESQSQVAKVRKAGGASVWGAGPSSPAHLLSGGGGPSGQPGGC